ncbi:MAG: NAD(P)-dependent alcohol dehydrogenase [Rhodobacteraceae bacterium]|nr:NAD(P)-dependent alcohol dehydrogenase [Paracoccaceae bacterium]
MKAITYKRYGGPEVLEISDVPMPTPKANEVLVKTFAATISTGDWRARSLTVPRGMGWAARLVFGVFGPRKQVLGTELSGVIAAVGLDVTKFKLGDEVFAFPGVGFGSHAEYRTMPEDGKILLKPHNLSFEQAAAIPFGGSTALDFLRNKGGIKAGESVLIIGASGAVGSAAVQLAKHFGAEVTGVCSTGNLELVRSLGADHVIDYIDEDFTKNGKRYDMIVKTTGPLTWKQTKGSLTDTGRMLLIMGDLPDMLRSAFLSKRSGKKLIGGVAAERAEDLKFLADLAIEGKFTPLVDRAFPFEQFVKAHALVDSGHKKGSVVLSLIHETPLRAAI